MPVKVEVVSRRFSRTRGRKRLPKLGAGQRGESSPTSSRSALTMARSLQGEPRAAFDAALAGLGFGVDVAVDELPAVLLVLAGHHALAGDRLSRPGDLREAHLEALHPPDAGILDQHLAEEPHGQHPLREDALV